MLFYILAALPGQFQCCHPEEEGRTAQPPRTAGKRERNSQTQQNGVSKWSGEINEMDNNEDEETLVVCLSLVCFMCRLILDRINRFEKRQDVSKSLEDDWSRSVKLKHQREEDERRFLRCVDVGLFPFTHSLTIWHWLTDLQDISWPSSFIRDDMFSWSFIHSSFALFCLPVVRSAGQLLVDKLAQYRRCCQCKRRTTNCGETNIWKDSHYLSGSQFLIWSTVKPTAELEHQYLTA